MKNLGKSLLAVLPILGLALGLVPYRASAVELRFGHVTSAGYLFEVGEKLKENIEKLSKGEIEIKVFPGSQLGNLPQMMGQLKQGSLDMLKSDYGLIMIAEGGKPFIVGFFPYLFRDQAHLERFISSPLFEEMMGVVEKKNGIKWIGLLGNRTPRALTTRHKLVVFPGDMKGLKIRAPKVAGIPESFQAWGASTHVISAAEMYNALKQKVVDGQENGIDVVYDWKLFEVQNYYTALDYVRSSEGLWMNADKFNSLSPDLQEVMIKATKMTREWANQYLSELTEKWIQGCRDNGMSMVMPPLKPWFESSREVIKDMDGKAFPRGLYDKIHNM